MRKIVRNLFFALFLILSFVSCGDGDSKKIAQKPEGSEGGPCYGNKTCDDDLVCEDGICVDPLEVTDNDSGDSADDGNTGNSGDSGNSGNTGDSGNSGDTGDSGNSGNTGDSGDSGNSGNSADDTEKTDDDIKIPENCGNGKLDEGEECDDGNDWGGDGCTPLCKINVCGDGYHFIGVEECDTKEVSCASLEIGTEGDALCDYYCKLVTEGICKRTFKCDEKPENTVWNSVFEYTQTWNGTEWEPADSISTYNIISSAKECRFKCAENYSWDGANCIQGSETGAVCTGQTKCYDGTTEVTCPLSGQNLYGQDSQYINKCIPRNYIVSGTDSEEIVTDNNSGLQWQRNSPSTKYSWINAVSYCENLDYGGKNDWKLPEPGHLATLLNYGKYNPIIDNEVFPNIQPDNYWTLTFKNCPQSLSFFDGSINNISEAYAICVRGDTLIQNRFTEYSISSDFIVIDEKTGITWKKEDKKNKYDDAVVYCNNLSYAGFSDWVLSKGDRIKTLIDCSKSNPASSFPEIKSDIYVYYKSTYGYPYKYYFIDFSSGTDGSSTPLEDVSYYFKCSRSEIIFENTLTQYTVSGQTIVTDSKTGLIWNSSIGSSKTWISALSYCESLNYAGFSDWRLPNVEELKTLINEKFSDPATLHPGVTSNSFWTSTSVDGSSSNAWSINFTHGSIAKSKKSGTMYAICMR